MSGQKINDHNSWMGKGSKGVPLPMGAKMKQESSAMGAGKMGKYEDTTEAIKAQQSAGVAKVHGHAQKAGHRN